MNRQLVFTNHFPSALFVSESTDTFSGNNSFQLDSNGMLLENGPDAIWQNCQPYDSFSLNVSVNTAYDTTQQRIAEIERGHLGFTTKTPRRLLVNFGESPEWFTQSKRMLPLHIINFHLNPGHLLNIGLPLYDIDVAHFRKIDLQPVVNAIYEILEGDLVSRLHEIKNSTINYTNCDLILTRYKVALIKTLLYIEKKQPKINIDWDRIGQSYPTYQNVQLDIENDSSDVSFEQVFWPSLANYIKLNLRLFFTGPIRFIKHILKNKI